MGEATAISWCDMTFNPWWGCWKIADECKNCYADATAARYAPGHWGRTAPRKFFGENHWKEPLRWNRKAERDGVRRRVFVGSMCDWAEIHPDPYTHGEMHAERRRLWTLIERCTSLDWLLLTKRPEDAKRVLPWHVPHLYGFADNATHPWRHVWIGVTAGTRESLAKNVPVLREINAHVRFISCEPLLEDIPRADWDAALRTAYRCTECGSKRYDDDGTCATCGGDPDELLLRGPDWLIVGDESGRGRRDAKLDWVRTARDAAIANRVQFHFKQWNTGERKKVHLPVLDGQQWAQFPEAR